MFDCRWLSCIMVCINVSHLFFPSLIRQPLPQSYGRITIIDYVVMEILTMHNLKCIGKTQICIHMPDYWKPTLISTPAQIEVFQMFQSGDHLLFNWSSSIPRRFNGPGATCGGVLNRRDGHPYICRPSMCFWASASWNSTCHGAKSPRILRYTGNF